MKKCISVLLAVILAAGVLFGCGSDTGKTAGSGENVGSPAEVVEGGGNAGSEAAESGGDAGADAGGDTGDAGSEAAESGGDAGADAGEITGDADTEAAEAGGNAGTDAGSVQAGTGEVTGAAGTAEASEKPLRIVATIFPEYDWVQNILGERAKDAELTLLLDNGVDLHSYQPTAADILKVGSCDLFIYVGGESDEWVEDALAQAVNPDMITLNLLETLGDAVREEEIVEGMQEEEHDHGHEGEEDEHEGTEEAHDHDHEEPEYDEHVWLSLKNASVLCGAISEAIGKIDPANSALYAENLKSYQEKLAALDQQYAQAVGEAPVKTLLFGDRFPFRYMTDDYGLTYYAAFAGCSAETEASFETILFLAGKVNELNLHSIMTIEGTDHRIAETIAKNTKTGDQQILTLDFMQSTTTQDSEEGVTYLSVMEKNLEVLREALK